MSKELEDRFEKFAVETRDLCKELKWDVINVQYIRQLIRSSGSVGANYIEASDDLGKLDERMKIKISRREAKESIHWLKLVLTYDHEDLEAKRIKLLDEGVQITKILSTILNRLH